MKNYQHLSVFSKYYFCSGFQELWFGSRSNIVPAFDWNYVSSSLGSRTQRLPIKPYLHLMGKTKGTFVYLLKLIVA